MTAQAQRTVLTYGTFDLFHPGHVQLLKRARELGTRLVVGLSTDEFNALKGKKSVMSFEDRKAVLEACRYVDEVFAEDDWDSWSEFRTLAPKELQILGDDLFTTNAQRLEREREEAERREAAELGKSA